MEYSPTTYQAEKDTGARRENGASNLQRLKPIHLKIVKLHIEGLGTTAIALKLGRSIGSISCILHDPLVKSLMQKVRESQEADLDALFGKVVDRVRDGLESERGLDANLKTIDRYVKLQQIKVDDRGPETAEDVIQRMLNIQINISNGNA